AMSANKTAPSLSVLRVLRSSVIVLSNRSRGSVHTPRTSPDQHQSRTVDIDDCLGKRPRGLLWKVVTNAAADQPVRVFARKPPGVGARVQMRSTIGIAFQRDRGHADDGGLRKPPFEVVVLGLALRQPEPPAVVVDHYR